MRTARLGATLSLFFLTACAFGPVDLTGRRCPCAPGYSCVASVCVVESDLGADAASDGGDAGDAGPDLGAVDGGDGEGGMDGGADAGSDAGPADGGVDSGCHTQALVVLAADDDGQLDERDGGEFYPAGNAGVTVACGAWEGPPTGNFAVWCYFRFALTEAIPASPSSLTADLTLWRSGVMSWPASPGPEYALDVYVEPVGDALPITTLTEALAARDTLTTPARWPTSGALGWGASGAVTSTDLSGLLAPVRADGGLGVGEHVRVWATAVDFHLPAEVFTPTYDPTPGAYMSPVLTIRWCD